MEIVLLPCREKVGILRAKPQKYLDLKKRIYFLSLQKCYLFQKIPGELSIATLAVLSIQRLLMILDGNTYKITSYSTAFFIIASIWIYALCLSLPPFFGFGVYVVESSGMT